uniref:Riboflavin transporter n=1 Tax=uncultured Bacillota bacterium TaxID=344338 RepID=A0A650EPZ7_9FIRM|nr:riboflavin transporter [uncultured Firmicutes bacterium]
MNTKTKKLTTTAALCAIAFVMTAVIRIPVVLFLKYDPKDIIIVLGGLIWGPLTSCVVSVIVSLIEMFTISDTGIWGCIMNIISTCAFACTAAAIYKHKKTLSGAVIGLIIGCLAQTAVMMLWNYLITPIYMGTPREAVAKLLLPAFLPFNLLKGGLNAAFTFLLYKPVTTALRKIGYISTAAGEKGKKPVGLWLVAGAIVITCVLLILSLNGII